LLHILTQDISEGAMDEMGGSVVAGNFLPAGFIYPGMHDLRVRCA
jgi:hypothetical protein